MYLMNTNERLLRIDFFTLSTYYLDHDALYEEAHNAICFIITQIYEVLTFFF